VRLIVGDRGVAGRPRVGGLAAGEQHGTAGVAQGARVREPVARRLRDAAHARLLDARSFTREQVARTRCAAAAMPGALTDTRALRDGAGSVLLRAGSGAMVTWAPSDRSHSDNQTQFGDVIMGGDI